MDAPVSRRSDQVVALTLFEGGRRLLETIAQEEPLPTVLDALCRLVEQVLDGCQCTVLVASACGHVKHGAAPSLSDAYTRALDGRPASPEFGPCGMAVAEGTQVIVQDIAVDERWIAREWSRVALTHGLRACWSTPILAALAATHGQDAADRAAPDGIRGAVERVVEQSGWASMPIEVLRDRYALLTPREREVMTWVVAGLPNKRIGAELGTAEITVKAHRGRVMRKMRAASLADLVRMAARLDVPLPRRRTG